MNAKRSAPSGAFGRPGGVVLTILVLLLPTLARAGRYHVSPGGERVSGPSAPGDWSPAACYPDLAEAAAAAAPGDTVLLDRTDHLLATAVTLPGPLLNRDLDADTTSCRLLRATGGRMTVATGAGTFRLRGLVVAGDGSDDDWPVLTIPAGAAADAELRGVVFRNLRGGTGGGTGGSALALAGNGDSTSVRLARCSFLDNGSRGFGGALWVGDGWEVAIDSCTFTANVSRTGTDLAEGRGGALAVFSSATPTHVRVRASRFLDNAAEGPGGTMFIDDGGLDMEDSELAGSTSALGLTTTWSAGAGIFLRRNKTHHEPLRLDLRRCDFHDNRGLIGTDPWSGDGGAVLVKGIFTYYVDVSVQDCVFADNFAAQGAGFYMGRYATGDVVRCRFLRNTAYLQGGAAFKGGSTPDNWGETATFRFCEFIGNRAGLDLDGNDSLYLGRGGAFSTRVHTRGVFINCSFLDNEAHGPASQGGAVHKPAEGWDIFQDSMRCALVNCAFWAENSQAQIYGDDLGYSEVTNCAMRPGDFDCSGVTPTGTVELAASPYQGPADAHPLAASPLVDAGVPEPPALDLDHNVAPAGLAMDIGAYEVGAQPAGTPALPETLALAAFPNPFNPAVTLSFSLPRSRTVTVIIHDLAGREVARLLDGAPLAAGSHVLRWNGRDAAGRAVASGLYLAQVRAGGHSGRVKLMLVR